MKQNAEEAHNKDCMWGAVCFITDGIEEDVLINIHYLICLRADLLVYIPLYIRCIYMYICQKSNCLVQCTNCVHVVLQNTFVAFEMGQVRVKGIVVGSRN